MKFFLKIEAKINQLLNFISGYLIIWSKKFIPKSVQKKYVETKNKATQFIKLKKSVALDKAQNFATKNKQKLSKLKSINIKSYVEKSKQGALYFKDNYKIILKNSVSKNRPQVRLGISNFFDKLIKKVGPNSILYAFVTTSVLILVYFSIYSPSRNIKIESEADRKIASLKKLEEKVRPKYYKAERKHYQIYALTFPIYLGTGAQKVQTDFTLKTSNRNIVLFIKNNRAQVLDRINTNIDPMESTFFLTDEGKSILKEEYHQASALEKELHDLEQSQSEYDLELYNKVKNQLGGISDRIYYLRLPSHQEKVSYLKAKGVGEGINDISDDVMAAISNRDIVLGMTKEQVVRAWGRPARVDIAGNPDRQNERWAFYAQGRVRYVFFEGGRVEGWSLD